MMCSTRELELGDDHEGIIELPADAPVGTAFADYADLDDPVIDVSITPNRQDCMGVRGIARDLAPRGSARSKPLGAVYRMANLDPIPGDGPGAGRAHGRCRRLPGFLRTGRVRREATAPRPNG